VSAGTSDTAAHEGLRVVARAHVRADLRRGDASAYRLRYRTGQSSIGVSEPRSPLTTAVSPLSQVDVDGAAAERAVAIGVPLDETHEFPTALFEAGAARRARDEPAAFASG
jgi:hypothetical protein